MEIATKEIKKEDGKIKRQKNLKPFKKGQSGNPRGRPPGTVSITDAIKRKLNEVYPSTKKDKNKKKRIYLEKIIDTILDNALIKKDPRTLEKIWAYMDGHPKATIDIGADKQSLAELTEFFRAIAKKK